MPLNLEQFGNKEQGDEAGTCQIEGKDIEDARLVQDDKEEYVETYIKEYEQQLQRGEADGSFLESEVGERQGLQGIHSHHHGHHQQVVVMLGITQRVGNGSDEAKDAQQEHGRQCCYQGKSRTEYSVGPGPSLSPLLLGGAVIGKPEQCCFHAKGQQCQDECRIGIDVGGDAVIARLRGHVVCVKWHKQIIEEASHNTAQSVYGSVFE